MSPPFGIRTGTYKFLHPSLQPLPAGIKNVFARSGDGTVTDAVVILDDLVVEVC